MESRERTDPIPPAVTPGLSTAEAEERLRRLGPNAVPAEAPHPVRALLGKLWAPVPWMLEAAIALELVLGRAVEAGILGVLLVFNAVLSVTQEGRAQRALTLLRERLTVQARVRRDGRWRSLPAQALVPGDVVHVRVGDLVPADVRLGDGKLLLDQSVLTGESLPVDLEAGGTAYAGAVVKRGEATGGVIATGARTFFGKTAELVRTAKTPSRLERVIFGIVRYLVALDVALVLAVLAHAAWRGVPLTDVLPFALILLIASVPVALPATFTLASALGALELARSGVFVTRLSAIEEAAGMDVLWSDKTGTLTENRLTVAAVRAYPPHTEEDVLRLGAQASDEATQDPLDLVILTEARRRGLLAAAPPRVRFAPFDPSTKRSEAWLRQADQVVRVAKGAPRVIAALAGADGPALASDVAALATRGARVLAVAAGPDPAVRLVGLIALEDPPRADSPAVVERLRALGVRVLMVTGDAAETARAIAAQVGVGARVRPPGGGVPADPLAWDVYAGVFPEEKFRLVRAVQERDHVVGMTGDGVNDAPALRQADVGVAVASATDVAKAAAGLVLTSPGLGDIVTAVEVSRRIYQRMLTYTLNKIVKTLEIALFLSLGFLLGGVLVTTPRLMVLLLLANDFVTMAVATDRVSFSPAPQRWPVRALVASAVLLALPLLALSFGVFWTARAYLPLPALQTLVFVLLVVNGQATIYLVRERERFWRSRPSRWLLLSSAVDVSVVGVLATRGWLMAPVPIGAFAALLGVGLAYLVAMDGVKRRLFARFRLR